MGMVVILIETEHHPDDREAAFDATLEVARASREDAACRLYSIAIDRENPAVTRVNELWDSVEAHEEHMAKPHVAAFFQRVKGLRVIRRRFTVFETAREITLELPLEG